MERKGNDYNDSVKQAEYYLRGVDTIYDIMHAKMLRIKSVLGLIKAGGSNNFESVEDSLMDLINYSAFMAAYLSGDMEGQNPEKDIFNNNKE